ncbi:MAG: DMT family transporter [Candidatus Latescibacteria bacterium]|nr:DMT family transporter [Candidatus Latescibacterota bacterium]
MRSWWELLSLRAFRCCWKNGRWRSSLRWMLTFWTVATVGAAFWTLTLTLESMPISGLLLPLTMDSLAYAGIVNGTLAYVVFKTMLKRYRARALASFNFVIPVVGAGLGVLLFDEPLTWQLAAGAVSVGVWQVNRNQ